MVPFLAYFAQRVLVLVFYLLEIIEILNEDRLLTLFDPIGLL